jgi:protocatechuate 3,4-dioxygenase beta subunit
VAFQGYGRAEVDRDGRYAFRTIRPVPYPGRTPHIHVKVTAPGTSTLTTQLYLPDSARNSEDGIFRPELVMAMSHDGDALVGGYLFVLDLA